MPRVVAVLNVWLMEWVIVGAAAAAGLGLAWALGKRICFPRQPWWGPYARSTTNGSPRRAWVRKEALASRAEISNKPADPTSANSSPGSTAW